jgi:hypothetical protein
VWNKLNSATSTSMIATTEMSFTSLGNGCGFASFTTQSHPCHRLARGSWDPSFLFLFRCWTGSAMLHIVYSYPLALSSMMYFTWAYSRSTAERRQVHQASCLLYGTGALVLNRPW